MADKPTDAEKALKKKLEDALKRADKAEKKLEDIATAPAEAGSRYKAVTASDEYHGTTCGIPFRNGEAVFDKLSLDKKLGYSLTQVVLKMLDMGYKVFEIDGEGNPVNGG